MKKAKTFAKKPVVFLLAFGEFNEEGVTKLEGELQGLLKDDCDKVIFNLSNVLQLTPAAIEKLQTFAREMAARNKQFVVQGVNERITEMMHSLHIELPVAMER